MRSNISDKEKKKRKREYNTIYYMAKRREINKLRQERRLLNREKINERARQYRKDNIENDREYKRKYRKANPNKQREYEKQYREKDGYREQRKQYRKSNKEKVNTTRRINIAKRRQDPTYRLIGNLRVRIDDALKGLVKNTSTMELLGCDIETLWNHLESLFLPGMTRENHSYEGWHVDHIKPCATFDLTDPSQQRECFHYTNLQPLWAFDNLSKGSKYEDC